MVLAIIMKTKRSIRRRTPKPIIHEMPSDFPLQGDKDFEACNIRQQKFIINVFLQQATNWSNAECYRQAYGRPNMKTEVASVNCNQLLKLPKISRCVKKIKHYYYGRFQATIESVLEEEAMLAKSDITDFLDDDGYLTRNPKDLPPAVRRSISAIEIIKTKYGKKYRVSLWNKGQSLQRLQSILGMNAPTKTITEGKIVEDHNFNIDLTKLSDEQLKTLDNICDLAKVKVKRK